MIISIDKINQKIVSPLDLANLLLTNKGESDKIVFTNGCFDIIHRGHIEYLAEASQLGKILIIGLNSDESVRRLKGKDRPINSENDRAFYLASLPMVDFVCIFNEDTPLDLIRIFKPDILVKGGDYTIDTVVGFDEIVAWGGKTVIIPLTKGYSTTNLIYQVNKHQKDGNY